MIANRILVQTFLSSAPPCSFRRKSAVRFVSALIWITGYVLLGASDSAWAADPDASVPDTWLIDETGRVGGAYNVGGVGWTDRTDSNGTSVTVTHTNGGSAVIAADIPQDSVLINQAGESFPNTGAGKPPFSIVGLGAPLGDLSNATDPSIQVDLIVQGTPFANSGITDRTVQVQLHAVPPPNRNGDLDGLSIHWTVNGGLEQTVSASEDPSHTFYLAVDGVYAIEAWARRSSNESPHVLRGVTIAGSDAARDEDGDGLPDVFEADFGFDPTSTDLDQDLDANGVADFIDLLCVVQFAVDATLDSDLDGKTDCEELLRGTNVNDVQLFYPDRPVNGDFYQVEYLLDGQVFSDAAQTSPEAGLERVLVSTPGGDERYDTEELLTDGELAALGLTQLDLPVHLRLSEINADLGVGDLPDSARIAADQSLVVLAYESASGPSGEKWAARAWIDAQPGLTPAVVTPAMTEAGTTWVTGSDWLAAYQAYLSANLVQLHGVDLSPTTGLGISLLESAAAYYAQLSEGGLLVFGDPHAPDVPDAVRAIKLAIGPKVDQETGLEVSAGRSLDAFHAELTSIAGPGGLADVFADLLASYYSDTSTFLERDTLRAAAALLQGDPADDNAAARYLPRLLTRLSLAELLAMSQPGQNELIDPLGDFDLDGLTNAFELSAPPPIGSDPRLADTDGDSHLDGVDPCPASFENACLLVEFQSMDSDGDGVVDSIDNCLNFANPLQTDTSGDGIGDACPRFASIRTPSSNLRILAGSSVEFTALPTTSLSPVLPIAYAWDFDGAAANSSAQEPGGIVFSTPGNYLVSLTGSDDGGNGQSSPADLRLIEVVLAAPSPTAIVGGPYSATEGDPILFSGGGTPGSGSLTAFDWDFGDGSSASGSSPSYAYASQGIYTATLTVRDSGNNSGSADAVVTIADSSPVADFNASPMGGSPPLFVQFTDLSTAHDGIASQEWDWDDLSPNGTGATPSHTFILPGEYEVELTVTDGDGSTSVRTQTIIVAMGAVPSIGWPGLVVLALILLGLGATRVAGARRTF